MFLYCVTYSTINADYEDAIGRCDPCRFGALVFILKSRVYADYIYHSRSTVQDPTKKKRSHVFVKIFAEENRLKKESALSRTLDEVLT